MSYHTADERNMDSRPAPLRSRRVCRFCLTESEPLNYIYERDQSKPFQVPLTLQIMSCVAIEVYAADGMPQMICNLCRWNLDRSYKFKLQCKKADEALRAYPSSGVLPRPFLPIAHEPPETGSKRQLDQKQHSESKKLRVDNGDRERRETRERERERERERDRDRDRDRDRERQGDKMKDKERLDLYEEEQDGGSDGEQDVSGGKEDRKFEPGEIRVHACDQCDRTFPLRQALALHIQRAHRDRNYKCTECDRMFFSKYDLSKHMTTHSEEKPYTCPICQKQFSRANLLQRHEKVHRDELRYGCQHCEREFFTTEELEKHEDAMHKKEKPFQCNICNKRFTYKQGLERHELLHNEDKTFVCEYCKEAFRTSTKLARHLTTHAGHRPYLCKLCPRTFLLSHHLTRHMRTHSVEKRHVCEDCGKAFKRKESLEVHQLTHTKRTGMGLTCDVCQESCRNRADYVTHIKQHIEAGEKMGPDGLAPDAKKLELDSEEEEEEEQYTDGDDDYEPPAYIVKKLPKSVNKQSDSEEDPDKAEKEDRKEHVVYVRGKDGNVVKKTIKTLMPIQRRDVQEVKKSPSNNQAQLTKIPQGKSGEEPGKTTRVDDTEAQVQKIVASVFKEHKIPLKGQNTNEQIKESGGTAPQTRFQAQLATQGQTLVKEEKLETATTSATGTPKSINTVKVIKRIVVRKAGGNTETVTTTSSKDAESTIATSQASTTTPGTGPKVTKRVIVRRIIRQGDTTREVIMNPDGTIIDPAELAKLPTGNVVKRLVIKKSVDKNQPAAQPSNDPRQAKASDVAAPAAEPPVPKTATSAKEDQETKVKLEQLEKRVEQQRLKIEELQARKQQQEYDAMDEMLPERHDESEDEQQLPLKRVFVKRKQSIYDEVQEYNDTDEPAAPVKDEPPATQPEEAKPRKSESDEVQSTENSQADSQQENTSPPAKPISPLKPTITSSKVYGNKKIIVVKTEDASEVEEMSRELCSILDSADTVAKIQETVLSNLSQIPSIGESAQKSADASQKSAAAALEADLVDDEPPLEEAPTTKDDSKLKSETEEPMEVEEEQDPEVKEEVAAREDAVEMEECDPNDSTIAIADQDLSETADIFETSDTALEVEKTQELDGSVIELGEGNNTINLNDTNDSQDSQDSLEDKLKQMEG